MHYKSRNYLCEYDGMQTVKRFHQKTFIYLRVYLSMSPNYVPSSEPQFSCK